MPSDWLWHQCRTYQDTWILFLPMHCQNLFAYCKECEARKQHSSRHSLFTLVQNYVTSDPGGPWGRPLPCPHEFFKIMQFSGFCKGKPLFLSNFWAQGPLWGQNSAGPPDQNPRSAHACVLLCVKTSVSCSSPQHHLLWFPLHWLKTETVCDLLCLIVLYLLREMPGWNLPGVLSWHLRQPTIWMFALSRRFLHQRKGKHLHNWLQMFVWFHHFFSSHRAFWTAEDFLLSSKQCQCLQSKLIPASLCLSVVVSCPPGFYQDVNGCLACPEGSYQPQDSQVNRRWYSESVVSFAILPEIGMKCCWGLLLFF